MDVYPLSQTADIVHELFIDIIIIRFSCVYSSARCVQLFEVYVEIFLSEFSHVMSTSRGYVYEFALVMCCIVITLLKLDT